MPVWVSKALASRKVTDRRCGYSKGVREPARPRRQLQLVRVSEPRTMGGLRGRQILPRSDRRQGGQNGQRNGGTLEESHRGRHCDCILRRNEALKLPRDLKLEFQQVQKTTRGAKKLGFTHRNQRQDCGYWRKREDEAAMNEVRGLECAIAATFIVLSIGESTAADPARGRGIAERWCSECHVVEPGQLHVPTFAQIRASEKFDEAGLLAFLAAPHHSRMPNLSLTRSEIADLVAYIKA